ncbi:MAG: tyrosine-protein phosphatase, partial [Comamonas sp.]|nr:tyrosine-protein phosphatase [Comamonas sp.]
LLTNQFYQRPAAMAARAALAVPQEVLDLLWRVQPGFLESAYAMVQREHGGMQSYLREVMQLDDAAQHALRARYLQA